MFEVRTAHDSTSWFRFRSVNRSRNVHFNELRSRSWSYIFS